MESRGRQRNGFHWKTCIIRIGEPLQLGTYLEITSKYTISKEKGITYSVDPIYSLKLRHIKKQKISTQDTDVVCIVLEN